MAVETKSEPFTEEKVTDLDVVFIGGLRDTITLRTEDDLTVFPGILQIKIMKPAEFIVMSRSNILSYRTRNRIIRRPLIVAPIPQSPPSPEPTTAPAAVFQGGLPGGSKPESSGRPDPESPETTEDRGQRSSQTSDFSTDSDPQGP